MSNREIAQALFVTVRTVEGHLTQSYMKLDIAGREQLAAALRHEAPTPPPARPAALRWATTVAIASQSTSLKLCIGQNFGPHIEQNSADLK